MTSIFMNAALTVFVGSIALYLAIGLLKRIAVPLAVIGGVILAVALVTAWRRRGGGISDDW